jgi:hypothetical protein
MIGNLLDIDPFIQVYERTHTAVNQLDEKLRLGGLLRRSCCCIPTCLWLHTSIGNPLEEQHESEDQGSCSLPSRSHVEVT